MENIWRLCGIVALILFGLLDTSHARPVGDGSRGPSPEAGGEEWAAGSWRRLLGPSLLAVAALAAAGGAALIGCCTCCTTRSTPKGFQPNERKIIKEFTDSGSSHSLSTGGYVNPAASGSSPASEFTIFPPVAPPASASTTGTPISFEPLPDIRPRQPVPDPDSASNQKRRLSRKKPAAFNNAVSHGLSAQDWFDDPQANFPRSQLKYLCEFGKGWFGRVVEGEALGLAPGTNVISPPTRVIVKILHGDATPTDQMYFLHEVRYLKDLSPHANILQLKGRCLETDPFLIILEACPSGDLKTFLLQNLATSEALSMQGVILRMACNVADGLQHMHERGFVHTDLAARNCLVASDLMVKIGDYGTSIENFKDDYYCADDVALPIRWCAPETLHCTDTTIETKEVTTSANIWSFGVFLWELCEFGRLPYTELNDEEVIVKVLSEKSLHLGPPSRPCLQSNNLYHLMRLCWNSNHQRPAMAQVTAMLHNLSLHPEQNPGWSFEDFECHWATMKPNGTTAVVETIVHEPPMEMQPREVGEGGRESMHRNLTPSPHPSLHDEPMSPDIKHKSPSLQNLHGSLEDLVEASCPQEEDAGKDVACPALGELNDAPCEDIPLEPKSSALWLNDCESQLGATEDDEDAQFVRKISEAIRDLDDVLALEKTSSSSGSGTSPEEHSPTKKRFAQLSHEKIDENGVLDFRLDCRKEEGEGISKEGVVKARVDGDVTEEEAVPLSTRVGGLLWEGTESIATEGFKGNANGSLDRGAGLPLGEGGGSAGVLEGAAKSKSALEEEEEEVWRQRVERCEFSAKVREKSRSVQDLMVLTHIDDSSEGSDCEGGGRSNVGSPPPGPLLQHPGHSPSFGSVGDLRGAVLGDEFRHTLERLCSANKRGSFSRAGPSLSMGVVSNFLEELEDTKSHPETSEQLSAPMSSHDNATIGKTKPLPSPLEPLHSVTSTISGPTPAEVCLGITINETSAGDLAEVLSDSCENEDAQSLPRTLHNQFVVESCKKFSDVITSTPIGNAMRNSSVNEDSFLFDSPLSDTAGQVECSTIKSGVLGSSVSSLDPTFPESSPTFPSPAKIVNAKSNSSVIHEIIKSENCDSSVSVKSDEVSGDITDTDPSLQTLSKDMSERAHSQSGNLALCGKDVTLMALVGAVNVPDAQSLQDIVKMSESPSSPLPLVATLSVSPLSILAMNCLSSFNPKHLDKNNFCTKFSNKLGDNVDASLSVIQGNDEKGVDQTAFEKSPQESPLSEFPGDLSEQSPLHCLTHGISGSQSTVECRSPLALSPITIGIEDANTTTSSILLTSVQQEMVLNDGSSPCEEKLKSDGVTKEINSDFIFAVGPSVENMDPVMKPDLLLDTEKLEKCTSLNGRQVQADLIGNSNINLQENVVEALITSIEADRNHGSWLKPNVSSKGLENSHILLDLVQINSNKLEKSSDPSDELSRINEPIQVIPSYDKKSKGPSSPEFLVGKKDINPGNNKSEKVEKECQSEEKENAMSDVANSEDCDSAGTEDSVFDFSPPAPDTNGDSVKMECSEHPQGRHIGCTEERHGGEGGRFDGSFEKSCFGPCEASVREDGVEVHGEAPRRDEEEDEEELVLLGAKQWTPDDERSSDSGFRDKGSLSESVEDACERCDLADVEVEGMGGGEMVAKVNPGQGCVMPGDYPGDDEYMNGSDEVYVSANEEEPSKSPERFKSSPPPPAQRDEDHEEFWRQQMASLRQAAGDTASLLREASAPGDGSSWTEGETWDEDVTGNCKEPNIPAEGEGVDRGLDEASLAALRSELQEKLGGSNNRFGAGVEAKGKDASYEGTHGEERLSEGEEEDDGEEASEERADITIHYDAYLAQLSPILEERESVGSSEMYSPASKEPPRDSVSDDSATTASVNDIGDNQVFLADAKNPVFSMEDVLVVDTSTNQASFIVSGGAVDLQENDATSPEFSDSLEDDDNEDSNSNEKSENTPKEHAETCVGDSVAQTNNLPMARYNIPPSDFWTGIPSIHSWNGINGSAPSNGGCRPSPPRSPLLLPPPPSSAPMPSPEEERAGCVERSCSKTIPIFRDFEDIVALCQTQRDDFSGCANVTVDGLQGDSQRSSEETETSISGSAQNIPFWESESSDGNDSSSSGEFVWKEGERDIPQAVDGPALESVSRVYESLSDFPMAVIEEEDEEEACDGEKDDGASDSSGSVMEFIPSVWNSAAEPGHSSLRSPDRKSDHKKNVSFKRQKYHCVYEYPKEEASDSESECQDSPTRRQWNVEQVPPLDYSSYADWELMEGDIPEGILPGEMEVEPEIPNAAVNHRQFDFYKLSSEDYDFGFVSPEASEGEFMVSSSSRPFQYCNADPSFPVGSQFFPGLSLTTDAVPGWVAGQRSSWSKGNEDASEFSESVQEGPRRDDGVAEERVAPLPVDSRHGEGEDGGKGDEWSSLEQPSPSAIGHSTLSSSSPPASPLSPTGLGELRHTRDRLKLDLPHKFGLCELSSSHGPRRDPKAVGGCAAMDEEAKAKRRAEEQKGEASLLDMEKEREGITKTAL